MIKNPPANARGMDSIPGPGRAPGGGHDNPLQYSCLENPMDRDAWQVTAHRVSKSQTQLKRLSTHAYKERKRGQSLSTTCKHSEKLSSTSQKVNFQVGPVQSAT